MQSTLKLFQDLAKRPRGLWLFSQIIAYKAPYFRTIRPRFVDLRPGYCEVQMKKRWGVQNHLKTVHAIAMCNLCEIVGGLMTEVSIPKTHRWIPIGMEVKYLEKATTNLRGIADINLPVWEDKQDLQVPVSILDEYNTEVVRAVITMRVNAKDKR